MKYIVCGGREYYDAKRVYDLLDQFNQQPMTMLFTGLQPGAEMLAAYWAKYRDVPHAEILPNYSDHGDMAFIKRNERIIENFMPKTTGILLFTAGHNPSAKHLMRIAENAGFDVYDLSRYP